ncbi:MAG TPA: hypothetical protein VN848_05750 [Gemmatimonadales bacterium]|nr:hypothetical protein [Gemmatimonadales bacterium]
MRALLTCAIVGLVWAPTVGLSQQASPYVPIGHWAMPFVEHLISAGIIADPTPDTRPIKQAQLLHALEGADTMRASPTTRATIRRLIAEWAPVEPAPHYRFEPGLGTQLSTFAFRDPLELDRGTCATNQCVIQTPGHHTSDHTFVSTDVDAEFVFGSVVGVSHLALDTRLEADPDWNASDNNATRFEEAYLSAQWKVGELFFGILDRNWGPSVTQGVLLSPNPYSLDHFAATVGTKGFQLQMWAAELDPRTDSTGTMVNRYMIQDRLWIHPPGRWTATLENAAVIAGAGRVPDLWYFNPASITYFRAQNGTEDNNFLGADFERHGRVTLFGQAMLDDIQVSRNQVGEIKPTSYAMTIGAKGGAQSGGTSWTVFYTQVASLTYRNDDNEEVPEYFAGNGIGRQFNDYDQATAQLNVLLGPTFMLTPQIDIVRQGQGDPHLLHPLVPQYGTIPVLLVGVVERIVHLAVGGSYQWRGLTVSGTAGVDFIQNANNVTGASQTPFLGSVAVSYHFHRQNRLP